MVNIVVFAWYPTVLVLAIFMGIAAIIVSRRNQKKLAIEAGFFYDELMTNARAATECKQRGYHGSAVAVVVEEGKLVNVCLHCDDVVTHQHVHERVPRVILAHHPRCALPDRDHAGECHVLRGRGGL